MVSEMKDSMIELRAEDCANAAAIQSAIDDLGATGGVVQLPALELTLDRGLELHTGVSLRGRGEKTILRKGPSRVYPTTGYHNYGMKDVPLQSADGLEVGMTVSVLDDNKRGFAATFARITWIDDDWVGLDRGCDSDYYPEGNPRLVTAYPMIFGHNVDNVSVHDLVLDGNLPENPDPMDGCRGSSMYFCGCDKLEINGVHESNYSGEGLGFQMCTRSTIRNSSFDNNTGNAIHPGAGTTDALVENCRANGNGWSGFTFCVRANHITVRGCTFSKNEKPGISIGTRDSYNLIEDCEIHDNGGAGIDVRKEPWPSLLTACTFRGCRLSGNAHDTGHGQIDVAGDAHDIIIEDNTLDGGGRTYGVVTVDEVESVFVGHNEFVNCKAETKGDGFTDARPDIKCGHEVTQPGHYRHLVGTTALT